MPAPPRLGLRSAYSILYGPRLPEELCDWAAAQGIESVALCDRDGLYGLPAFYEAAREAGIRALPGAALTSPSGDILALPLGRRGFSRLCRILSDAKLRADFDPVAALKEDAGGLALASASPALLSALAGRVPRLYAALGPGRLGAVGQAKTLGLPLLAVDEGLLLEEADRGLHALLRAIALGKTLGELAAGDWEEQGGLILPAADYERALAPWPEALAAAQSLVEETQGAGFGKGLVFPEYPGARKGDPHLELRERVYAGAEARYGELSDAVLGRIEYELELIEKKGFSAYFLVMDDIVAMSPRTCGRGSAAASIVSYALSITNVDPLDKGLYFERFLNEARSDPPDIDVDFAWDERDALIRRVIERFGPERCARVANHNRFRLRSAFRESAKARGFADAEISEVERRIYDFCEDARSLDPPWGRILEEARRLEGLPRGLSMHCGGLVVAPGPVTDYAPVERSAEGFPLLAWEKEGTEQAGLVKLDLLGNRSLAVIRDVLSNLEEEGLEPGPGFAAPERDPETVEALARGDSMGVFYIESPAMRLLQRKTGKGDFDHIVIHSSIIRPAANRFIEEYVRRLKGGVWKHLHPRLAGVLDETLGIMCYQEDVSKTAIALAGMSESEADGLRKTIAKKAGGRRLEASRESFYSGCRKRGVDEATIDAVWEMMLSFDGYSFCKPHSASYAMVSFQSAYLRVHHPAAFMAAVLSNQGGYYQPGAYVSELRRMGLPFLGPDVQRSEAAYKGRGNLVIAGLMAVHGLSRAAREGIPEERRRRGPFRSLEEAAGRLALSREDLIALVSAGAFDCLAAGLRRSAQVRVLLGAKEAAGELFGAEAPAPSRPALPARSQAEPRSELRAELRAEFGALGYLREAHPFLLWREAAARVERTEARELPRRVGRRVRLLGWPVTQKEVMTKDGLVMNFLSLEDETALYDTVLFPEVYERSRRLLVDQRPLVVEGLVKSEWGAVTVELFGLQGL